MLKNHEKNVSLYNYIGFLRVPESSWESKDHILGHETFLKKVWKNVSLYNYIGFLRVPEPQSVVSSVRIFFDAKKLSSRILRPEWSQELSDSKYILRFWNFVFLSFMKFWLLDCRVFILGTLRNSEELYLISNRRHRISWIEELFPLHTSWTSESPQSLYWNQNRTSGNTLVFFWRLSPSELELI